MFPKHASRHTHIYCYFACCRTNGKYVLFTSVHWYKATSETFNTAVTLLDEDPIRQEMTNFKKIVEISNG